MIVKCAHCRGLMRVDHKQIPAQAQAKVRCPHCRGLGLVRTQPPGEPQAPSAKTPSGHAALAGPSGAGVVRSAQPAVHEEPEYVDEYLFPAERETLPYERQPGVISLRIVAWAVASVLVVLLFALLVNLILPGPQR